MNFKINIIKKTKNSFFKQSQKFACAEEITKNFELSNLFQQSIYIEEHKIIVHYPVIKTFINPTIYDNILNHFDALISNILIYYKDFEIHLDIKSFTMTIAQRYNELIKLFCNKYLNEKYAKKIKNIYIYNPPNILSVLRKIFHPFISENARSKIIIC